MRIVCILAFWLWCLPLAAQESAPPVLVPWLPAAIPEAALAVGMAPPGATIIQDGRTVIQQDGGYFFLAVPQLAKGTTKIRLKLADGTVQPYSLPITPRVWDIQRINGLPGKMVNPPASVLKRINQDNAAIGTARRVLNRTPYWRSGFILPAVGRASGAFGGRRILNGTEKQPHRGYDIAAPVGTPVIAPADGIVTLVHEDMYYTGKTVMLDHGYGLTSILIHMSKIAVKKGQTLRQGDTMGAIGQTGRATGPHLHWGVFVGNIAVDPAQVLAALPKPPQP